MKSLKPILILSALSTVAFIVALQDQPTVPDTPEVRQIKAQYEKLTKAYNEKNLDTVMNLTMDEFTMTMVDGKTLKREPAKSSMKEQFERIDSGKWTIKIENAVVVGTIAHIVAEMKFDGRLKDVRNGRTYPAEITSKERHTWSLGKDMWKMRRVELLSQDTETGGAKTRPNVSGATVGDPPPTKAGGGSG